MTATPSTRIRPCTPGDEAALALVGQATFLDTFAGVLTGPDIVAHCARAHALEVYREWLADSRYALWLVEGQPGDAPVGYMVVSPPQLPVPDTDGDLELKRIYLLGRFQGTGVGRRLLDLAVAQARIHGAERLLLGVYAHNDAAIGFYERSGFTKIGTRTFTVGSTVCDDYIMGLTLPPGR